MDRAAARPPSRSIKWSAALLSVIDSTSLLFWLLCIGGGNHTGGTAYKTYADSVLAACNASGAKSFRYGPMRR